jgi:hypothetical protein
MIEESINIIKHGIASLLAVFNTQEVEIIVAGNVEIIVAGNVEIIKNKKNKKTKSIISTSQINKSQKCYLYTIDKQHLYSKYRVKKIIKNIDIKIDNCEKMKQALEAYEHHTWNTEAIWESQELHLNYIRKSNALRIDLDDEEDNKYNYINKIKRGLLISIENEKNIKKNVHIILNIHNIPYELCDYIASFVYITSNELKVCCKLLDNYYYDY